MLKLFKQIKELILIRKVNEGDNYDILQEVHKKSLKRFIQENGIKYFSNFLRLEEQYLLNKIELNKRTDKNDLLMENAFLLFVSVTTIIPLIIVCKPGTRKSLSPQ